MRSSRTAHNASLIKGEPRHFGPDPEDRERQFTLCLFHSCRFPCMKISFVERQASNLPSTVVPLGDSGGQPVVGWL